MRSTVARPAVPGAILWARYSYPPNELGYCGPPDHRALLQYGAEGVVDGGLEQHLRGFAGAFPYMELIARATGIKDPFDRRVVEAYWVGNDLLERVDMTVFGNSLWERFRHRAGNSWNYLAEALPAGAVPHHSFHVFGVYPWVGRLRGERGGDRNSTSLEVLDRCRIRWGQVKAVQGDQVVVEFQRLTWDGSRLGLGPLELETVTRAIDGTGFVGGDDLAPGAWVSLHWHWLCDRLTPRQLTNLKRYTAHQLAVTNDRVRHPGPMTLGSVEREF